jgi:Tol biopolymer transport system component
LLVISTANAAYAEPGYLVYLRDKTLVAQPFDRRTYALSGEPHALSDQILFLPQVNRAIFSVSSVDVLVTQTGKGANMSQLAWFDRSGKPAGTVGQPGWYDNVRLSPDGHRVATDQTDPDGRNIDVWVHELSRSTVTRLTFDPALDQTPVWSVDSQRVLYSSNRGGTFALYLKNADGSGSEQLLVEYGGALSNAWDWSHDGKYVLVRKGSELAYLALQERTTAPLFRAQWTVRGAQFSPDGRWIAYASNETGNMEVYVSPFPSVNGKWQVSNAGGQEPKWRNDGKELFYMSPDGKITAVSVSAGSSFQAGTPVPLFQTHRRQPMSSQDLFSYDVSNDGQRFLIATKLDEPNAAPLSVLLNWASEMEK